jgi:hypothetical protein
VANHDGSRMLSHVISLLRRERVFRWLGRSRSQRLVLEIVRWADDEHDCPPAETLEGHGAALGVCSYCLLPAKGVVEDLCPRCRAELDSLDGKTAVFVVGRERPSGRTRPTPRR